MSYVYIILFLHTLIRHSSSSDASRRSEVQKVVFEGGTTSSFNVLEAPYEVEKVAEDEYCNDYDAEKGERSFFTAPFFSGRVRNFQACRNHCLKEVRCKYMSYWRSKKCETYASCYSRKSFDAAYGDKVGIYKKVAPCEVMLDRYYNLIGAEFPENTLRPLYIPLEWEIFQNKAVPYSHHRDPNFHCHCTGIAWMTCGIFVAGRTEEFRVVNERLSPLDAEKRKPFEMVKNALNKYGGESHYLTFSEKSDQGVLAEIELPETLVHDHQTVPGCIHIQQCIEGSPNGMCPVQRRPFQSGEPVYLWLHEAVSDDAEQSVICMSLKGLRSYMINNANAEEGGFKDPLGRERPDSPWMTIDNDYIIFFVFDDAAMSTGMCKWAGRKLQVSSDKAVPSSQSEAGPSSLAGSFQNLAVDSPDDSPGKARKKGKRRSGGKKRGKQTRSSGESVEDSPELGPSSLPDTFEAASPADDVSGTSPQSMPEPSSRPPPSRAPPPRAAALPRPSRPALPPPPPPSPPPTSPPSSPSGLYQLNQKDIAKLRRSFEAGKARRDQGRRAREEHISTEFFSKSNDHIWSSLLMFFILIILCLAFNSRSFDSQKSDVYIEF